MAPFGTPMNAPENDLEPSSPLGLETSHSTIAASPSKRPIRRDKANSRRSKWLIRGVVLALIATNVLLVLLDLSQLMKQTRVGNGNLARAVSERVEATVVEVEHVLGTLAERIEELPMTRDGLAVLQGALISQVARLDQLDSLNIYDATGARIATSEPLPSATDDPGGTVYVALHRDRADPIVLGPPFPSLGSADGWMFPMSRRIEDGGGKFEGVVVADISIDHLRRVLSRFDIGEGAITLTLGRYNLVRQPFIAEDVGKLVATVPAIFEQHDSGSGEVRSPSDGKTRLFSFERTQSYPIRVVVASSKWEVLTSWLIASSLQTLWVLVLCFVLKRGSDHAQRALLNRQQAERSLRKAHAALADANKRLQRLAQFDELTSLPNRRYFDRRFARAFKSAMREREWLAVVMIDIDHFKTYNDCYGHPAGDKCLATVAAAMKSAVARPRDFIARYGGEEIVMLLPGSDAAGAARVAEAARQAVADANIGHTNNPAGFVTVSLGVAAMRPAPGRTASELLQHADDALYEAKRSGRNRVAVDA